MDLASAYANEVPDEIKSVVKGLDSDVRIAIIIALMKNGKRTFSDLKHLLHLNSSSLSRHLSILQDGGLIKNILEWNENSYSYYVTTDIAERVLRNLSDTIIPNSKLVTREPTIILAYINLAIDYHFPSDAIEAVPRYKKDNQ
jgi:DNA-binding transcriptional ArsR family regulator